MKNKLITSTLQFLQNEEGDEAVEMAVLFPIILLIVGFIIDRFVQYEGVTAVSSAANEAIRYAVVEDNKSAAIKTITETVSDRMESSGLGWCTGNGNNSCKKWKDNIRMTDNVSTFKSNKNINLLVNVDNSSIFPSYESFQNLVKKGGPVFHQHSYIITARVESNKKCA